MSLSSEPHEGLHGFPVHVAYDGARKTIHDVKPGDEVSVLLHRTVDAFGVHDRHHFLALFRHASEKVVEIANDQTVQAAGIRPDAELRLGEKDVRISYNGVPKDFDHVKPQELVNTLLQRVLLAFGIRDRDTRPHAYALYLVEGEGVTEVHNDKTVHDAGIRPGSTLLLREKIVSGG